MKFYILKNLEHFLPFKFTKKKAIKNMILIYIILFYESLPFSKGKGHSWLMRWDLEGQFSYLDIFSESYTDDARTVQVRDYWLEGGFDLFVYNLKHFSCFLQS